LLFGQREILVPAISLVNGTTVTRAPRANVTYVHVMFDRHELVTCSGFVSESFFPGESGLAALNGMEAEIRTLFPEAVAIANRASGFARPLEQNRTGKLLQVG